MSRSAIYRVFGRAAKRARVRMHKRHPRIAIDGAQSTGKSVLLQALRPMFESRLSFITEASREIAQRFSVRSEADWERLFSEKERLEDFFRAEEQWQTEQQCAARNGFIIDSSLMLTSAYRKHFGCGVPLDRTSIGRYDLILYCPPYSALSALDGFRFLHGRDAIDMCYRELVDRVLQGVMVALPVGPDRMNAAVTEITKLLDY